MNLSHSRFNHVSSQVIQFGFQMLPVYRNTEEIKHFCCEVVNHRDHVDTGINDYDLLCTVILHLDLSVDMTTVLAPPMELSHCVGPDSVTGYI